MFVDNLMDANAFGRCLDFEFQVKIRRPRKNMDVKAAFTHKFTDRMDTTTMRFSNLVVNVTFDCY